MTSTRPDDPDPGLPGGQRRVASRPTLATLSDTRSRRTLRTTSRRWARRATTLWPFADAEPLPGTAHLPGWLGQTILTLVTRYTLPGDRVLLLAPPATGGDQTDRRHGARPTDDYRALTEAVWTVTRLGRSTDTATAAPNPLSDAGEVFGDPHLPSAGPHSESESGPGLTRPGPPPVPHRTVASPGPEPAEAGPSGTFDLIITAVHPHSTDWLLRTDWNRLMTPNGIVAVITHSDCVGRRLKDPIATIVRMFSEAHRGWLDHIAILNRPWPDRTQSGVRHAARSIAGPRPVRPVHRDLLLFGPLHVGTDITGRTDSLTESSDA